MPKRGFNEFSLSKLRPGDLSYWPNEDIPHPFGTAFGLSALIEARKRGYQVPDQALAKMAKYLERNLQDSPLSMDASDYSRSDADTRALFVMTLGRLGKPQTAYISTLWQNKAMLSPFGLSLLAVAMKEASLSSGQVNSVLVEIKRQSSQNSTEDLFQSKTSEGWSFGSQVRSLSGALMALYE